MTYDIEEQDSIEALKASWQRYGKPLTYLLIAILIGVCAWNGWQYWQRKQATEAAVLYDQIEKFQSTGTPDAAKILRVANDIQNKFPATMYAQLSALIAAKVAFDTHDHNTAKAQLTWALKHGTSKELQQVAQLRLSTILLNEKKYDEAIAQLKNAPLPSFTAIYAEQRGDILFSQQKIAEARAAYKEALEKTNGDNENQRRLLNLKLDMVGDTHPL